MASQEVDEKNYFSITWTVNNFSYCWQKKDESISSPIFSIFIPEETRWKLVLFPRGTSIENSPTFFLYREKDCNGSENIDIECDLVTLNADGTILKKKEFKFTFRKDSSVGCRIKTGLNKKSVLKKWETIHLPQDMLTMRCVIKRIDGKSVEIRQLFARTIITVERRTLLWTIQEFNTFPIDQKKCLVIKSASGKELIKIDLFLTRDHRFEENINLNIYPIDKCMKFFTLQTYLTSTLSPRDKMDAGKYRNWCKHGEFSTFQLKISRNQLLSENPVWDLDFPMFALSLRLEFAISTGFSFEGVTNIDLGTISQETTDEVRENWQRCDVEEKNSCALATDLMSLYEDQTLCDVKLQTKTNVFPVHSTILSARSPVFRAMFSTDMKEKSDGIVDVSDLDDEIVRQLILFLYTNKLENLIWEDALRLYGAADKYAVTLLKDRCSLFLKDNLDLKTACGTLILSDLHQDEGLKSTVQDFILKNAKDIFKSEEWKLLADTNSTLALETTLRN